MNQNTNALIEDYMSDIVKSTGMLHKESLYGQMLIIMYSSIDSMGLLDAPEDQQSSTGESFKSWVRNYLLPNGNFEFNEMDLWAARCSILHTFTSESDLSKKGRAKEIQYFSGNKDTPQAQAIVAAIKQIADGNHTPAHIEDLITAFYNGIKKFCEKLSDKCNLDRIYEDRVKKLIQKNKL